MNVLIQFDDQNLALATAIGAALSAYGSSGTTVVAANPEWDTPVTDPVEQHVATPAPEDVQAVAETIPEDTPEPEPEPTAADVLTETADKTIVADLADIRLDEHGIPFDAAYCADAKDPFYGSGKRAGQWKRRRGVSEKTYDEWYASQRPALDTNEAETVEVKPIDTAKAFATPAATEDPAPTDDVPADAGALMLWASEQTAAGNLTNEQVTAAYQTCGITIADMFGTDQAVIDGYVKQVYAELTK